MHCIHSSEAQEGCGRSPFCKDCIIRNTVTEAFQGDHVVRRRTRIELIRDTNKLEIYALITVLPFHSRIGYLRRSFLGSRYDSTHHEASLQPLTDKLQDDRVRNAMGNHLLQPFMLDVVKISTDIGLEQVSYLLRDDDPAQRPQSIVGITPRSKSIRTVQEIRLVHRLQYQCYRSLQQAIFDCRNTEWSSPCLARPFGNLHSAYRWTPVGPSLQAFALLLDPRVQVLFKLLRRLTIDSARTAPVHLLPGFFEEIWCEQMRQRGEA